jgi:hypothetical protein
MDIISRDVALPLLTCNLLVSDLEKDRFLDLFHRLLNQTAATHTFQVESVVLPLPAFNILAHIAQQQPERQQAILSILENTLTNWSKQIKVCSFFLGVFFFIIKSLAITSRRIETIILWSRTKFHKRSSSIMDIKN